MSKCHHSQRSWFKFSSASVSRTKMLTLWLSTRRNCLLVATLDMCLNISSVTMRYVSVECFLFSSKSLSYTSLAYSVDTEGKFFYNDLHSQNVPWRFICVFAVNGPHVICSFYCRARDHSTSFTSPDRSSDILNSCPESFR